jgi:NADH-quinone oxidoreductase subunit H
MNFAWKFMLPMSLINLVTAGVWHFLSQGVLRWIVCSVLVVVSYILLGRGLTQGWKLQKRVYQFAE